MKLARMAAVRDTSNAIVIRKALRCDEACPRSRVLTGAMKLAQIVVVRDMKLPSLNGGGLRQVMKHTCAIVGGAQL